MDGTDALLVELPNNCATPGVTMQVTSSSTPCMAPKCSYLLSKFLPITDMW